MNILFVCLGNICRSPTADAVFRTHVHDAGLSSRIRVDSAGTGSWHIGDAPDRRATSTALKRGYDLSAIRSRKVRQQDFNEFDFVLAMDAQNLSDLLAICPAEHQRKVELFLNYAPKVEDNDVPDPYYGVGNGFERVLDMIELASQGLLDRIKKDISL